MLSAQYVSIVLRACPGAFTEHQVRYHLPQERGWAYVHAWQVSQGVAMRWRGGADARWWDSVVEKLQNRE